MSDRPASLVRASPARRKGHPVPRRPRLLLGLLAAAVIATAGCTLPVIAPDETGSAAPDGGASGAPAAPGGQATWRPCPDVPRDLVGQAASTMTYECATVPVPRNWAEPQGEKYD